MQLRNVIKKVLESNESYCMDCKTDRENLTRELVAHIELELDTQAKAIRKVAGK